MTEAYKEKKYFGMAIDPIHVGTGRSEEHTSELQSH